MSTRTASLANNYSTVTNSAMVANIQSLKCLYQAPQQVKLLHLHAEIESLLLHLQALKRQRLENKHIAKNGTATVLNR